MNVRVIAIVLSLVFVSSCGSTSKTTAAQSEEVGLSFPGLFASPTSEELVTVRDDWLQRDLNARDIQEEYREVLADGRLFRIFSHTSTAGKHFGVIISPSTEAVSPLQGFPIMMSLSGFGPPFQVHVSADLPANPGSPPAIILYPSYRGQTLVVGEQTFTSEGPLFDLCDGGTDDILTFLNVAIEVTPNASSTVMVVGGSRGGNTGMLAAVRDERIQRVVSLAGPDTYLVESYRNQPNFKPSYDNWFLKDLTSAESSVNDARARMIACSPLFFTADLPSTQLHHGVADVNVPFETLGRMRQSWTESGRDPSELETYAYEGVDHTFQGVMDVVRARINAFILSEL